MKKIIAILLVLAIVTAGVFAAAPTSLKLQSTIEESGEGGADAIEWGAFWGSDVDSASVVNADVQTVDLKTTGSQAFTMGYKSNLKATTVKSYEIDYSITDFVNASDSTATVSVSLDKNKTTGTYDTGNNLAAFVKADTITASWTGDAYLDAGVYESTITITYTAV